MRLLALPVAFALLSSLGTAAHADLVIQGRSAQALHCAAMLYMVSDTLHDAGYLDTQTTNLAKRNAVIMLDYVPGTKDEKVQAMGQRFNKLMATRSMGQLLDEYNSTSKWCRKTFLN